MYIRNRRANNQEQENHEKLREMIVVAENALAEASGFAEELLDNTGVKWYSTVQNKLGKFAKEIANFADEYIDKSYERFKNG